MEKFIHLQVKSHFSINKGLPKVEDIVDKAIEKNMPSVALTDKNSFFGLVKFYKYAIETVSYTHLTLPTNSRV